MQIYPLGECALIVEFGKEISLDANRLSIALAKRLENMPFPGFIEAVPAYTSVGVFYDPIKIRQSHPDAVSAFASVRDQVMNLISSVEVGSSEDRRTIEVPVIFGGADGPDLAPLAKERNIPETEFVEIFISTVYRVYMLGFLPGFAYMGEVDERIAAPRLSTPRSRVPKGSVGIAGRQTGIYPFGSPGGWQLIGRTDMELFDLGREEPSLFRAGDLVRFVQI